MGTLLAFKFPVISFFFAAVKDVDDTFGRIIIEKSTLRFVG